MLYKYQEKRVILQSVRDFCQYRSIYERNKQDYYHAVESFGLPFEEESQPRQARLNAGGSSNSRKQQSVTKHRRTQQGTKSYQASTAP